MREAMIRQMTPAHVQFPTKHFNGCCSTHLINYDHLIVEEAEWQVKRDACWLLVNKAELTQGPAYLFPHAMLLPDTVTHSSRPHFLRSGDESHRTTYIIVLFSKLTCPSPSFYRCLGVSSLWTYFLHLLVHKSPLFTNLLVSRYCSQTFSLLRNLFYGNM